MVSLCIRTQHVNDELLTGGIWMLTYNELKRILGLNEILLKSAIKCNKWSRVIELLTHRSIVKDMIIEALETKSAA